MAGVHDSDATFQCSCNAFRVAVAPWRRDPMKQRAVKARVEVSEQRAPEFALRFELEVLEEQSTPESDAKTGVMMAAGDCPRGRLTRLVTQRQMLQAFVFAFVGAAAERHPPSGEDGDEEAKMAQELDSRVKKWLAGGGEVDAPPREELARWLVARMILTSAAEDTCKDDEQAAWMVCLCGEKGAECMLEEDFVPPDSSDVAESRKSDCKDNDEDCGHGSDVETEDDDLPPAYEEAGYEELKLSSPETNEEEVDTGPTTKVVNDLLDREKPADDSRPATKVRASSSRRSLGVNEISFQPQLTKKMAKRKSSARSSSSRSLRSTVSADEQKEKRVLKPTVVHLNPRVPSVDVVRPKDPPNEWSEDKRHFQKELLASRRDLQAAKQQHEKVQRIAALRHSRLLKETARKLHMNEQKRRDAREVRQLIADTLEYREELHAMEFRVKQATITAHREQERVKCGARVALGNTEKSQRGAVKLGPGPLSEQEMQLINGDTGDESLVYDLDGRRHRVDEAEKFAKESALESAMRKVRRLLFQSGSSVDVFRRYDLDRSGALSYDEFQRMMRENGTGDAAELTREQSAVFFKQFDIDNSGEVDYCELLWGFFNQKAFRKRWRERKSATTTARTNRQVKNLFLRCDRTGRGMLPLKEFQLVMDHLGVTLSDIDAKLLAVKFDSDKEGYIDYLGFLNFVNGSAFCEPQDDSYSADNVQQQPTDAPSGMERILLELQALSANQAKFHRILQK